MSTQTFTAPTNKSNLIAQAKAELGKFLKISKARQDQGKGQNYMPGGLIDEVWHEMLQDRKSYEAFATKHAGSILEHNPNAGYGTLEWVPDYEARFGLLSEAWFADKNGVVDESAVAEYRATGNYTTSWDCTPDSGDSPTPN